MDLNILANDEGFGKYISSYFTTSTSFRGAVSISSDGQVMTYRLPGQYDGARFTDVLTYTVRDGRGASAHANVSIRIAPGEWQRQHSAVCFLIGILGVTATSSNMSGL
jgi:hypothetical protein